MDLIKKIIEKYIGDSSYKKNVITMVIARVLSQAIPILLTPLLTRIYSPEQFGVFAVYSTIISIIALVSNGRYCLAIILPKSKEKAKGLFLLSSILTGIILLLFSFIFILWGNPIFSALNVTVSVTSIIYILLSILFVGLYEPLFYYALRNRRYKVLASNVVWQAFTLISVRIILGYLGFTDLGLIASFMFSYLVAYFTLLIRLDIKLKGKIEIEKIKGLLKEYFNFPRYSLFADLLNMLTNTFPNILLNKFFGNTATGYFSIADKVLGSPIWFITSSVGDVFKQEAAEQYRKDGFCLNIFIKTAKTLLLIGIIPFILIFLFIPPLVPFLFGEMWAPSGEYIQIFSLMYFSSFVVNPVSYIIYIVNKQNYAILFQGLKLSSILIAFMVGFYFKDLILAIIIWSVLVTLSNIIIFIFSYKFAKESRPNESS